ncbi:hypothetical protein BX070DRAFT_234980 [Coemansia spiralis]|nr:hypothetical protein BX070DRAFT_234980 [Coemansia spiralis]
MPTSIAHQSFWDRIPNATTRGTMLSRRTAAECKKQKESHRHPPLRDLTLQQARVSKRKQSRPMRSPFTPTPTLAIADTTCDKPTSRPSVKARRLSLDQHPSQSLLLRTADASERGPRANGNSSGVGQVNLAKDGASDSPGSSISGRAFRLSFSDDYLRNPHEYVQALIDSETLLATPVHKSHSTSSTGSRARRSTHGGGSGSRDRARQSSSSTRRNRSGRFHNLQLEQTIFAAQSENDDVNSVTTAASDMNDLADLDGQVPETPTRPGRHGDTEASEDAASKPQTPATPQSAPVLLTLPSASEASNSRNKSKHSLRGDQQSHQSPIKADDDGEEDDDEDAQDSRDSSQPASPAPLEQAADGENRPSYERQGQDFGSGTNDDLAQITPPHERSTVKWTKADPIDVVGKPMADKLASAERHCCSVLRILPEQYMAIKYTLLKEGRSRPPGTFKKRDAQRLCRIDVNKTSKIYEWYVAMGWLAGGNGVYAVPSPKD